MRKRSTMIGKPVVAYDTGEHIGKVEDCLVDLSSSQVVGFVLSAGHWTANTRLLPLRAVQAAGPDAILIPSRDVVVDADQRPDIKPVLERERERKQLKILTTDGRDLGTLVDVYFDEQSGAVQGYEVVGGLFAEASFGRSFVPVPRTVKVGMDVAFVPSETVDMMTEQEADVIADTAQTAAEPKPGARKFVEAEPLESPPPRTVEQTKGRRVRRSVQTPAGVIVAAQGQIVTEFVIEQARKHHQEQALVQAVMLSPENAASARAAHFWETAGERVREEVAQVLENTVELWGRVKETVADVAKRGGAQQREEQQASGKQPGTPSNDANQPTTEGGASGESGASQTEADKRRST